jgi:hypothetical protein
MHEILFGAGLGALAAGFAAALGGASRARLLALLAAGGTLGALAGRRGAFSPESDGAGRISVVRVALNSVEDERLALLVAQECRARGLYVRR